MNELKCDVCLYFKVFGLGQDENGKPCYAGMKINLGRAKKNVPYSEIQKKVVAIPNWKEQILHFVHLDTVDIKPENIDIITPEEYDRDYGDDQDEDNENE